MHYIAFIWCSLEVVVSLLVGTFIKWQIVSEVRCKRILYPFSKVFSFEVVRFLNQSSLYLGDLKKLLQSAQKEACCSISHFEEWFCRHTTQIQGQSCAMLMRRCSKELDRSLMITFKAILLYEMLQLCSNDC